MPYTTIREIDNSTADVIGSGNATYVPGYALTGPAEPTLVTSVAQFETLYGTQPYRFTEDDNNNQTVNYQDGDFEISYNYARGILQSGGEVVFERIVNNRIPAASIPLNFAVENLSASWQDDLSINSTLNFEWIDTGSDDANRYVYTASEIGFRAPTTPDWTSTVVTLSDGTTITSTDGTVLEITGPLSSEVTSVEFDGTLGQLIMTSPEPLTWTNSEATIIGVYETTNDLTWTVFDNNRWVGLNIVSTDSTGVSTTIPSNIGPTVENGVAFASLPYGKEFGGLDGATPIGVPLVPTGDTTTVDGNLIIESLYRGSDSANVELTLYRANSQINISNEFYNLYIMNVKRNNVEETLSFTLEQLRGYHFSEITSKFISIRLTGTTQSDLNRGGLLLVPVRRNFDNVLITQGPSDLIGNNRQNNFDRLRYIAPVGEREFTVNGFYAALPNRLSALTDRDAFGIEFITTGGYPNYGNSDLASQMLRVAATRTETIALLDPNYDSPVLNTYNSVNGSMNPADYLGGEWTGKYGAMFVPAGKYSTDFGVTEFPGSYAYLRNVYGASSVAWNATAGVNRGLVPTLIAPNERINAELREQVQGNQGVSINPIVALVPFGFTIRGNRTFNNNIVNLTKSSFLNIRRLCNEIKKVVYPATESLRFEQDSIVLWDRFRALLTPTLDRMITGFGIQSYKIVRVPTTKRATIAARIEISPIEAIENFEISLELSDTVMVVVE